MGSKSSTNARGYHCLAQSNLSSSGACRKCNLLQWTSWQVESNFELMGVLAGGRSRPAAHASVWVAHPRLLRGKQLSSDGRVASGSGMLPEARIPKDSALEHSKKRQIYLFTQQCSSQPNVDPGGQAWAGLRLDIQVNCMPVDDLDVLQKPSCEPTDVQCVSYKCSERHLRGASDAVQ